MALVGKLQHNETADGSLWEILAHRARQKIVRRKIKLLSIFVLYKLKSSFAVSYEFTQTRSKPLRSWSDSVLNSFTYFCSSFLFFFFSFGPFFWDYKKYSKDFFLNSKSSWITQTFTDAEQLAFCGFFPHPTLCWLLLLCFREWSDNFHRDIMS